MMQDWAAYKNTNNFQNWMTSFILILLPLTKDLISGLKKKLCPWCTSNVVVSKVNSLIIALTKLVYQILHQVLKRKENNTFYTNSPKF